MSHHHESIAGLAAAQAAMPAPDIDITAVAQHPVTAWLVGATDTNTK